MSSGTMGKSRRIVIGWAVTPKAWWPELPGKASDYVPPLPKAFKRMCRDCGTVEVKGLKRYCERCARTRNRGAYRISKHKSRSRVQKTGFSPVAAEEVTKANMPSGYGSSGIPDQSQTNSDLKEAIT